VVVCHAVGFTQLLYRDDLYPPEARQVALRHLKQLHLSTHPPYPVLLNYHPPLSTKMASPLSTYHPQANTPLSPQTP
jgi:hypothetical protein